MIRAQSADDVIHEFPDGTAPAVVDRAMKAYAQSQAKPQKRSLSQDVTGFMSKVNRGLGVGDEMAAGFATARDIVTGKSGPNYLQTYKDELGRQRNTEDAYQAAHPHVAALATGTGNALTMAAPVGPGAQAFATGGRAVNALRGATVGGLTAAGYAAVDRGSAGERFTAASEASRNPLSLGLGAAAGALSAPMRANRRPAAPTLEQIETDRTAAYDRVRANGETYSPEQFRGLTQDMAHAIDEAGFHAGLHPKTASMMERLGQSERGAGGYAPTIAELDQLRQQIGRDVASSPDAGERRMGAIMRSKIDDFIEQAGGSPDLLQGRELNTRAMKLRSLDNLDEAATDRAAVTGSGGNINNTTRQNALRFRNATHNLTPAEEAAANRVIHGTPTGNALRLAGKLSPEGNGLMAAGHIAAVVPSHGFSAAIGLGGAIAKRVADHITARNVQALRNLIATGGHDAAVEITRQLADPQYAELRAQLANDLSVAVGVQGASRRGAVETYPERGVASSRR